MESRESVILLLQRGYSPGAWLQRTYLARFRLRSLVSRGKVEEN